MKKIVIVLALGLFTSLTACAQTGGDGTTTTPETSPVSPTPATSP